ncbi:phosphate acetyltransferase [Scrofimicrobium canadense]|nr:phosphate acetyltransferase [Scrofimicrobium canadense]
MSHSILVTGTAPGSAAAEVTHQLATMLPEIDVVYGGESFTLTDATAGTTIVNAIKHPQQALKEVTVSLRSTPGAALIAGLSGAPAPSFDVLGWNLDVAANAGAKVILVIDAAGMGSELLTDEIASSLRRAGQHHASVSGIVLVGSNTVPDVEVPVVTSPLDVEKVRSVTGPAATVTTPLMFQGDLMARARSNKKTIVLPEPEDARVLTAAARVLADGVANIVLVGDETQVRSSAQELDLDISDARIVGVTDPELSEKYATEFARLRAHKGVSIDDARQKMRDVTYFATMMVQMGDADGMVSGAAHTTAETIVPAFQIIKTAPGVSIVSSSFLMLLADQVLVLGDCAVNTNPTSNQLAEIAVSTAQTAAAFGLDPKVAMLSYSTGSSGSGADVDLVREATEKLMQLAPELSVEGPLQYDAAVSPEVAASKAPGSAVAGKANVLIFPNLTAGNIAYKAIQRSAGAVAVGPILQGLRRPVNDLSRGALVEDIVNTVAITAVQAGNEKVN